MRFIFKKLMDPFADPPSFKREPPAVPPRNRLISEGELRRTHSMSVMNPFDDDAAIHSQPVCITQSIDADS
jgi:hypothetical protein